MREARRPNSHKRFVSVVLFAPDLSANVFSADWFVLKVGMILPAPAPKSSVGQFCEIDL